MSDTLIRRQIVLTLEALAQNRERFEVLARELEAKGHRIVIGADLDDDHWSYQDYRTGEVLATGLCGDGSHDAYDPAPEVWTNEDYIFHETWRPLSEALVDEKFLPRSLAEAIADWALEHEEDARDFVTWSCGSVKTGGFFPIHRMSVVHMRKLFTWLDALVSSPTVPDEAFRVGYAIGRRCEKGSLDNIQLPGAVQ